MTKAVGIPSEEWTSYVQADRSMRRVPFMEAELPDGKTLRYEGDDIVIWTDPTARGENLCEVPFSFWNGSIVVKNAGPDIRRKMYSIAMDLGAIVVGEEGELYGRDGEQIEILERSLPHGRKPWWKLW